MRGNYVKTDIASHNDCFQALPKPASAPCVSCPYRLDAPSGLWDRSEYEKLPSYDDPTWSQSPALFMCHQQDGCLCSGWLACHDTEHLLALRINAVDASAYDFITSMPVFKSGADAMLHGLAGLDDPGDDARKAVARIERKRSRC